MAKNNVQAVAAERKGGSSFLLVALAGLAVFFLLPSLMQAEAPSVPASANVVASEEAWRLESALELNRFLSTDHAESDQVIKAVWSITTNGYLRANCDESHLSNGSVCIYGGVEGGKGHVAILWVVGSHVDFFVVSTMLSTSPGPGLIQLGEGQYFNPSTLRWTAAWIMTKTIGRGVKPESEWLTAGEGWARWMEIKTRYSLVVPLGGIQLPRWP